MLSTSVRVFILITAFDRLYYVLLYIVAQYYGILNASKFAPGKTFLDADHRQLLCVSFSKSTLLPYIFNKSLPTLDTT